MTVSDENPTAPVVRFWKEGPLAFLQLNRPHKANAYNDALLGQLAMLLEQSENDPDIHVVVITGTGSRSFCAGADLDELKDRDYQAALHLKSARIFASIVASPLVTMAAINGAAVAGGLELALACDLRIAGDQARFFFPETKLGLIPAAGGTQRLPQLVGIARAKELILGGRVWQASDAMRFGLVSDVVPEGELLSQARAWAQEIAGRDRLAQSLAKRAIDSQGTTAAGFQMEAIAEALLYQLRRQGKGSKPPPQP